MARFYADENFNLRVVEHLRKLGHDVLTVQEAGRTGQTDLQVLADATTDGRAVLDVRSRGLCPDAPPEPDSRWNC